MKNSSMFFVLRNCEKLLRDELYVMLMLMRAEDETPSICEETDVKVICAVEEAAEEYKDCPAACRKDNSKAEEEDEDNTVVKSGDLAVTAKAAEGKKALIDGISDLDTITFKTSEEVTISSITLERYGYSTKAQVKTVQLEDEDGNIIADAKEINNKGQVKLTLKKDYKTVDGTFKATVVLTTNDLGTDNGSTIGFKVIAAESTAKNLNLDDYTPYTYDLVNYAGSAVQFSSRNSTTKDYNWEAGKLYEVAKFRVKAPADSTILVKGFTLTDKVITSINIGGTDTPVNAGKGNMIEADKYAKDVTVTVNGKEVSGLKWNINKSDELVLSFDEVEVAGKETATIAVNMSFTEEFDNLGTAKGQVQYYIADLTKFNAVDKKTDTRVSQDAANSIEKLVQNNKWTIYTFKGGKTKLSGTKLGTINAAAGSTNVKVAEGEIKVTEALRGDATIDLENAASLNAIDEIRLVINGEEYDGTKNTNTSFKFTGLEIEKSGKVEVRVDLKDADELDALGVTAVNFAGSLNSVSFNGLKYDESGEPAGSEVTGSISISNIRIQAAKASLNNKNTTKVELVAGETNRKTIFDGTYEAKKGNVTLKNFAVKSTATLAIKGASTKLPTFYVTIDGEEYDANFDETATTKYPYGVAAGDIDDIEVADGKTVSVKVEIEYTPDVTGKTDNEIKAMYNTFNIELEGEDDDNNPAGFADEDTVRVEVVKEGTINITDSSAKKTVLLKSDRNVAKFTIKPSKSSDDDIILNSVNFVWDSTIGIANVKFTIDDDDYMYGTTTTPKIVADAGVTNGYKIEGIGTSIPADGVVVNVTLKSEAPEAGAKAKLTISKVNGKNVNSEFSKYYVPALVKLTQDNAKGKDTTTYTAELTNDTSYDVSTLKLYINGTGGTCTDITDSTLCVEVAHKDSLSEGSAEDNKFSATNDDKAHSITAVSYVVATDTPSTISIYKSEFENFFEKAYGSDDLMVYSNKS